MRRPATFTRTWSAARPIVELDTAVSSTWIGRSPGGNAVHWRTEVSGRRDRKPTRMPPPVGRRRRLVPRPADALGEVGQRRLVTDLLDRQDVGGHRGDDVGERR